MDVVTFAFLAVLICIAVDKLRARWKSTGHSPPPPPVQKGFSHIWGHLGELAAIAKNPERDLYDGLEHFVRTSRSQPVVSLYCGPPALVRPIVFVLDPKVARRLSFEGGDFQGIVRGLTLIAGQPVISSGHMLADAERTRRKKIMALALFRPHHLRRTVGLAGKHMSRLLLAGWFDENDGVFDVSRKNFQRLVHSILLDAFISVDSADQDPADMDKYLSDMHTWAIILKDMIYFPADLSLYPYVRPSNYKRVQQAYGSLSRSWVEPVIKERQRLIAEGEELPDDALSSMLAGEQEDGLAAAENDDPKATLNSNVACAEMTTILFASDTMSSTMVWLMLHLADNPAAQQKCYEEVVSVIGKEPQGDRPNLDDISELNYLFAFIKESQRFQPIAHALMREAKEDYIVGDYTIPKGAWLMIPTQSQALSDANFPESDAFRPERWLDDTLAGGARQAGQALSYAPFGLGTHQCFGRTLARTMLRSLLALLLQTYRVERVSDPKDATPVSPGLMYFPKKMAVRCVRREVA
eukprot:scpid53399/ scgid14432/ 1,25-dihydroxyvitamin D(3) 24-hydroxylase, mitochondrial; Cytochrome P450 24A1; Cytochrome P450-CC24